MPCDFAIDLPCAFVKIQGKMTPIEDLWERGTNSHNILDGDAVIQLLREVHSRRGFRNPWEIEQLMDRTLFLVKGQYVDQQPITSSTEFGLPPDIFALIKQTQEELEQETDVDLGEILEQWMMDPESVEFEKNLSELSKRIERNLDAYREEGYVSDILDRFCDEDQVPVPDETSLSAGSPSTQPLFRFYVDQSYFLFGDRSIYVPQEHN